MDGGSRGGSHGGRDGRENAGMSNAKRGGIPLRRKPEVSRVKAICPGVSRPLSRGESRRRWEAGQHSRASRRTDGVKHRAKRAGASVVPGRAARLRGAEANPCAELSREGVPLRGDEARAAVVPGKSL